MRDALRAIDRFSGLSDAPLTRLVEGSEVRDYAPGAAIRDPASAPGGYAFLIEGRRWMRRTIEGRSPREWVDDRPGNRHGGIGPIDAVAPPEVRADEACRVLHVPRDLLDALAGEEPHLGVAMLRGVRGDATMLHSHATGQ